MTRSLFSPALPLLLLLGWLAAFTPSAKAADQVLTQVSDVLALGPEKANDLRLPVKLRGVVTYVLTNNTEFKLHDGTGGIGIKVGTDEPTPEAGQEVEVTGYTNRLSVQGHSYTHVHGSKIILREKNSSFPAASQVTLSEVAAFKHYDQWVSVEGTVVIWMLNKEKLTLFLTDDTSFAIVHLWGQKDTALLKRLHGAHVRITGVNMGSSHTWQDAMIAPTPQQLEVLKEGTEDIFQAPPLSLADIVSSKDPVPGRVRATGTVIASLDGRTVHLRDGPNALRAQISGGWEHSTTPGIQYGDNGTPPQLAPGDVVELVGSIMHPNDEAMSALQLFECHARVLKKATAPAPLPTTLPQVASGAHLSDLVQLKARLVALNPSTLDGGYWRTTMNLEAEGATLVAYHSSRQQASFNSLRPNDEVQITGLVVRQTNPNSSDRTKLRIIAPEDVQSLGIAPAVLERQLWAWGGIAAALMLLLGLWITSLRRALNRQRDTDTRLRELNATLEDRVAERTQQLEASQNELERALKQEKELGDLKTRFVTMVSHEFRTPLGITMSAVELMRHYDDKLPGDQRRELCDDIYTATRNMAGLMEQVLVLGRVEAGKLGYRPAPLDLHALAIKLTDESLSATNRKCPIRWQPEGDLSGSTADESLLRHILGNLITNAVKYSPDDSEVIFSAHRDGTDVVFQVRDRGIGIPEQDRDQLFEAFHRCSNVGDVPGTGLGLVIVKRCVDLHGGRIALESAVGVGTTFTVRMPVFAAA